MTTSDPGITSDRVAVAARPSGIVADIATVATRGIRGLTREPESVIPALLIPMFFFFVNIGALEGLAESSGGIENFRAFQLPVAIVFAVTGVSRAPALVTDIQGGYFDRLLATPVKRPALLLGLMIADVVLILTLSALVTVVGFLMGVRFATGVGGVLVFLAIAALWGLAFTGFAYAIALKTGNPAAVNSAFLLFFPFTFLTSSFLPIEALSGWMQAVAKVNPVTYLLDGLRALITQGWEFGEIAAALIAIAAVGAVSFTLAFLALKGRVDRS